VADSDPDVIVLGAGPNGLTAGALLAGAGVRVLVLEAGPEVGGAVRTAEATLPGYRHDVFSGFYPLARVGPISLLPLEQYGLRWASFDRPYGGGTPTGDGFALEPTPGETRQALAQRAPGDVPGWDELWALWRRAAPLFMEMLRGPLGSPLSMLKLAVRAAALGSPWDLARLGLLPARSLAEQTFTSEDARVWLIGSALHSDLSPEAAGGAMYSLVLLGLGQEVGMPIAEGGAGALAEALRRCIEDRGGTVRTGERADRIIVRGGRAVAVVSTSGEMPARRGILATIEPQQLFLRLVDEGALSGDFLRAVRRYEWGTGVFKLDCALSGLPAFHASALNGAGVLHLGDSVAGLSLAAGEAAAGLLPRHPFLIVGVHTLADPTRAPPGGHTLWIETHVPSRIRGDARETIADRDWQGAKAAFADRVLEELERYAPGVRTLVAGVYAQSPDDLYAANANLVGGDNGGGSFGLHQQFVFRPVPGWFRHRTPIRGLYVGGASTHPGGGVHGACGANAARVLLEDLGLARRFPRH
jgi:phytoene dehydrogenase-like protein